VNSSLPKCFRSGAPRQLSALENDSAIVTLDFFTPFHDRPAMDTLLENRFDGPTSAIAAPPAEEISL
jgi:hypothetical protein